MIPVVRRRTRAALAGLVLGAGMLAPLVARAQTTTGPAAAASECVDVTTREDLAIRFCGPVGGRSKTAEVPLSVEVRNLRDNFLGQPYNVSRVALELVRTIDDQQLPDPATRTWEGDARATEVDWAPVFTTNGTYDLRVSAAGTDPRGQQATATVPLQLAVPPHPPTGVKAEPITDPPDSVAVTWTIADREPDVLYYEISRAAEGATTFNQLQVVEATVKRLVDTPPAGSWRYRVTALRRGATADDGVPSAPTTTSSIEVAAPADPADDQQGGDATTGTTVAGSSSGAGGRTTTTTARPSISNSTRSTVDLSGFASGLGSRRTPTTVRRVEPDPGFSETLPFDVDAARPETEPSTPPLEIAESPEALGEELISDDGERRRSLGFVAFGLLLFVLGMTGLFLKSEVRRADELEAIDDEDAGDDVRPAAIGEVMAPVVAADVVVTPVAAAPLAPPPVLPEPEPEPAPLPVVAAPLPTRRRTRSDARAAAKAERAAELAELFGEEPPSTAAEDDLHLASLAASLRDDAPAVRPERRVRRTVAPIDAPGLDVPDPVVTPSTTRTAPHARRAPTRLPPRPADDRREGGAAVRAGRRGAGEGHRRVPLG